MVILLYQSSFAQLKNFDKNGKVKKAKAEKIIIQIETPPTPPVNNQAAAIALAAIGTGIDLGLNAVKTALANREASFTSQYEVKTSNNNPFYDTNGEKINISKVKITRQVTWKNNTTEGVSEIVLSVESKQTWFRFKTESVNIKYSKARIKKCGIYGKTIDLNIQIVMNAVWGDKDAKNNLITQNGSLGSSSITVKGITLGTPITDTYYSDWYTIIPNPLNRPTDNNYTIDVQVQEANPYGVTAKAISDFFNSNQTQIDSFLKSLIPSSSSTSK